MSGVIACLLAMSACHAAGAREVTRDRRLYSDAIATSRQDQVLLNMVKTRYADPMVFLDVTSIINQYSLEGELRVNAQGNFDSGGFFNTGATGRYADRPTITYAPMNGERFTRGLLTPITPVSLLSLVQAGWRIDYVFGIAVQAVNGLNNGAAAAFIGRPGDPEFSELLGLLRDIQATGSLSMRVEAGEDGNALVVFFHRSSDAGIETKLSRARELLRLGPEQHEFRAVYAAAQTADNQLAILSRSMTEIILQLAQGIEVPPEHIADGRASPGDPSALNVISLRVRAQQEEPEDAQVKVFYPGYWFWIDDRDLASKRVFTFLIYLFSMAEGAESGAGPGVTINAGA